MPDIDEQQGKEDVKEKNQLLKYQSIKTNTKKGSYKWQLIGSDLTRAVIA